MHFSQVYYYPAKSLKTNKRDEAGEGEGSPVQPGLSHSIQNPIEEINRLWSRIAPRNLQSLVDHNRSRRPREAKHLSNRHPQDVAVDAGHALQLPVRRVLHDQVRNLRLASNGHAEDVLGKAAHIGVILVPSHPESIAHLVRRVLPHIELKEHLHGKFARLAALPRSGHAVAPTFR